MKVVEQAALDAPHEIHAPVDLLVELVDATLLDEALASGADERKRCEQTSMTCGSLERAHLTSATLFQPFEPQS